MHWRQAQQQQQQQQLAAAAVLRGLGVWGRLQQRRTVGWQQQQQLLLQDALSLWLSR
jgi:hypothetical protein